MKTASPDYRYQNLGAVYRLIEQFELISRTDLAKLSSFAPASMTGLTKILIDHKFIMERTSQNLPSRGRPAVGLSLSPFHWTLLCLTLSSHKLTLSHCVLNGTPQYQQDYTINDDERAALDSFIAHCVADFIAHYPIDTDKLFAVSVSVVGKISADKTEVVQLGNQSVNCVLHTVLSGYFSQPIFINEHFQLWFMAESALGNLISHDDAIYLQLDTDVNLSVLLKGNLLHQDEHKRMNVDKMMMPRFSGLSDEISDTTNEIERYQLKNQIAFTALTRLIDRYLPNSYTSVQEKIHWFCDCVDQNVSEAEAILEHLCNNLAYMLMNLINLFSTEKVMFNSPLLRIKQALFSRLQDKLQHNLLLNDLNVDLVTSQYDWDSPLIPAVAIKLGIYEGTLLKNQIKL